MSVAAREVGNSEDFTVHAIARGAQLLSRQANKPRPVMRSRKLAGSGTEGAGTAAPLIPPSEAI
jgi:hypothetical protein